MQVVLPELDGRIGMLLIGHKQDAVWHPRTQCPLSAYAPDHDGIRRAVTLAKNWTTLRQTTPATAASPSSSPTTPSATAASPTASATTPRNRPWKS